MGVPLGLEDVLRAAVVARDAAPSTPRDRELGGVLVCEGRDPGWFRLASPPSDRDLELVPEGRLRAGARDDPQLSLYFTVLEVVVHRGAVMVRVSPVAPAGDMVLVVPSHSKHRMLAGLHEGLTRAGVEHRLLAAFLAGNLTSIGDADVRTASRLAPELTSPRQAEAFAACCSPGVQVVWGPPGTGKTRVIAAAVNYLVREGHRVLLISHANIAVDNALFEVTALLDPAPGVAVRVGSIHLPAVAEDDRVNPALIVRRRLAEEQAELDDLTRRITGLGHLLDEAAQDEGALEQFDAAAYRQLQQRGHQREELQRLVAATAVARSEHDEAEQALRVWRGRLACASWLAERAALREAEERLDLLREATMEGPATPSWSTRLWLRLVGAGREGRAIDRASREVAERRQRMETARAAALALGVELNHVDTDDPASSSQRVAHARAQVLHAEQRDQRAAVQLADLAVREEELRRQGAGDPEDPHESGVLRRDKGLWDLHRAVPGLRAQAAAAQAERVVLKGRYDVKAAGVEALRQSLGREVEAEARVVATTTSQLALRPGLRTREFDHVIVDEAAFVELPYVALAVAGARVGVTLVGDYLQNAPISDDDLGRISESSRRLFALDCFSHLGVTDPSRDRVRPGVVVLQEQHRFGEPVTVLANRVAYGDVLTTGSDGTTDVVVLVVDGVSDDVGQVRRTTRHAGWWVAGTLVARALAEFHQDPTTVDPFGVVVPYKLQKEADQAALAESGLDTTVPVGTSHAFQGRQFDTVLVDLVEDGYGWVAAARLRGSTYEKNGVRLFNVAVTRARRRLYVLVGARALVRPEGPLKALRQLIDDGLATVVQVGELLGLPEPEALPPGPLADLHSALAPFVRVTDVKDEGASVEEIVRSVDHAQHEIWCWSAWIGTYAKELTQALVAAHVRGVRVTVVSRPERAVQEANRRALEALVAAGVRVVRMRDMHQKIVVVDGRRTFFGSLNVLSYGPTSSRRLRDVMIVMDGPGFASRLLEFENSSELGRQHTCVVCTAPLVECGLLGSGRQRGWRWVCPCGTEGPAFPTLKNGSSHNQPSRATV